MGRAEATSNRPYEAYQAPRIADFNTDTLGAFDKARNIGSTYQPTLQAGQEMQGLGAMTMATSGQYQPTNFMSTYRPQQFQNETWNADVAQRYMNPYTSSVLDLMQNRERERFKMDQVDRDLQSMARGTFGGSRQDIASELARDKMNIGLRENEAQMLSRAYDTAFSNFNTDRGAGLAAFQTNDAARRAAAEMRLKAAEMGDSSRRFGSQQALALGQGLAGIGSNIFNSGLQTRTAAQQDIDLLRGVGDARQKQAQSALDLAYSDFVNQRDYERGQLNFLSGILRGVPVSANSTVSEFQRTDPASQMASLGLGAVGLAKGLA